MKKSICLLLILGAFFTSCTKKGSDEGTIAELKDHNMKIIPDQPTSKDEIILVIYNDCEYNKLSQNKRNGKTITIEKQFNSSMKLPCIEKNDTIVIGKLTSGTYSVNYQLIDLALNVSNPVSLSFSFSLPVSK
jgi:hypothetical protein